MNEIHLGLENRWYIQNAQCTRDERYHFKSFQQASQHNERNDNLRDEFTWIYFGARAKIFSINGWDNIREHEESEKNEQRMSIQIAIQIGSSAWWNRSKWLYLLNLGAVGAAMNENKFEAFTRNYSFRPIKRWTVFPLMCNIFQYEQNEHTIFTLKLDSFNP